MMNFDKILMEDEMNGGESCRIFLKFFFYFFVKVLAALTDGNMAKSAFPKRALMARFGNALLATFTVSSSKKRLFLFSLSPFSFSPPL